MVLNGWFVWKANMLNGLVCTESWYVEWCDKYGKLIC